MTAAAFKVSMQKKSQKPAAHGHGHAHAAKAPLKAVAGDPAPPEFVLFDNEDDTFTIRGKKANGDLVDLGEVVTLTVTSSDTSVLTVDNPVGASCTEHALKAGSVVVSISAAWNDGSVGPFAIEWPQTVKAGGVTGLVIEPGTPVPRP